MAVSKLGNIKENLVEVSGRYLKIFIVTATNTPKHPSDPFMISLILGPVAVAGKLWVLKDPVGVIYS
jgi:hypothetical protein